MENLVRSAIAPETIVAEVAQNTVWNTRKPSVGSEVGSGRPLLSNNRLMK